MTPRVSEKTSRGFSPSAEAELGTQELRQEIVLHPYPKLAGGRH